MSIGRAHGLISPFHPCPKRPGESRKLFRANHCRGPCLESQRRRENRHRAIHHRHNSPTSPAFTSRIPNRSRNRSRKCSWHSPRSHHLLQRVNPLLQNPRRGRRRTIVQQELFRRQVQLGAVRGTRRRIAEIVQSDRGKQNLYFRSEVSNRLSEDPGDHQRMESQNVGVDGRERVKWNLMVKRVTP